MTRPSESRSESQPPDAGPVAVASAFAGPGAPSDAQIPGIPTPGRGWARAGAVSGAAVSIAANVLHSFIPPAGAAKDWAPHGGAVFGAVWWPVSLFIALEVLVSSRWGESRWWLALRLAAVSPVAVVGAVVSYHHLSGLLAFYGEDGFTVRFGPVAVDGLMVVCSAALYVARSGRQAGPMGRPSVASEPAVGRGSEPPGPSEPLAEPASEPARLELVGRLTESSGPAAQVVSRSTDQPAHRPTEPRAEPPSEQAQPDLRECGCGLDFCSGPKPKSTRNAHRRRVREAAELASRAAQNGHREPVSAG